MKNKKTKPIIQEKNEEKENEEKNNNILLKGIKYVIIAVLLFFIFNMDFGVIEAVPDNIPIAGNLDEMLEFILLMKLMPQSYKKKIFEWLE